MRELALPPRIQNSRSQLTEIQQVFLDCYILRIGNPKLIFQLLLAAGKSPSMSNSLMKSLIDCADGKEYIRQRTEQLEKYFFSAEPRENGVPEEVSMEEVQKTIYNRVSLDLIKDLKNGEIDYKSSAIIEKFMQKALDYKSEDTVGPEPPKIYLPENCLNCRYRIACESDDVVDDCKWCKYRKSCNERGEVYDQKTQLEIPEEELKK